MYREMLDEFENIIATDSADNIRHFASEVIDTIEKEATLPLVGAALRPIGRGLLGVGKKVGGGLHKAQMNILKDTVKSPMGLALTGGATALVGPQAVAEGLFPMIPAAKQAVGQVSSDLKNYSKLAHDEISSPIEKIAFDTTTLNNIETKDLINAAGASLVGGGLGYVAASKGFDFLDNTSTVSDIGSGTQRTISNIGKGTVRAFTRNRPGTNIVANVLANTGRFADSLSSSGVGGKKIRTDFSTLTGKPGPVQMTKTLGKFLGILAGAALAEEYFANWARNKIDGAVVDYKVNRLEDKIASTVEPEKDIPLPKKDLKRLLHDRSVKPVLTTGTFLFTLGALSNLTGRNLYGGMERVEKDEYRPANRVIIDIADPDAAKKYYDRRPELIKDAHDNISSLIDKVADVGGVIDMERLNEESKKNTSVPKKDWVPETKLDKMKASIDEKVKKAPKPIQRFDSFLANADKYKYTGRTGLGHWLLEELPFKSVESLAYAAPMIATAVLLNRNAKRGFAPLQSDPNTPYVPEGMTRVIIQESGYKDKDGKAVFEKPKDYTKYASENLLLDKTELDKIQEVIDRITLEGDAKAEAHALRYITKNEGIVSGVKKKERMEC